MDSPASLPRQGHAAQRIATEWQPASGVETYFTPGVTVATEASLVGVPTWGMSRNSGEI